METTLHFRPIPIKTDFSSLQGPNPQKHPQTHPNPKYIQSHHFYALKHPLETSLPFTRPHKNKKKTTDAKRHPHTPKSAVWECLAVPVDTCWCLWVSVCVSWCLLVSVGVCWCFVLSRYVLKMPREIIRGYMSAFCGCLWILDASEGLSNVQPL